MKRSDERPTIRVDPDLVTVAEKALAYAREQRRRLLQADPAHVPSSGSTRARVAVLRHSFGTHAAMFGVNPWKLMTWMGHKRIDETMLYVNFAGNHLRQLPHEIITAPQTELDPDRRIVAMLGARGTAVALEGGAEKEVLRC